MLVLFVLFIRSEELFELFERILLVKKHKSVAHILLLYHVVLLL